MNIFDIKGEELDQYRAAVLPEEYPDARPMMVHNWSDLDREMYCGGVWCSAG